MTAEGMRLQKFLSRSGVASRREAERLMVQGRVRVNGNLAVELGSRVNPGSDRVEVDGKVVRLAIPRWIMLNKPRGVVTTRRDPADRRTVYSLLAAADRESPLRGPAGPRDRGTAALSRTKETCIMRSFIHRRRNPETISSRGQWRP